MQSEKLRQWALIAEIISAVAVVLSLIFLAFQIRDGTQQTALNTQAVQATALQQHFQQHTALVLAQITNPELDSTLTKGQDGLGALTSDERTNFIPFATSELRNHFVAYELMQSGLLPESQWQTFRGSLERSLGRSAGLREVWEIRRDDYPDGFRALVDALVNEPEESGTVSGG